MSLKKSFLFFFVLVIQLLNLNVVKLTAHIGNLTPLIFVGPKLNQFFGLYFRTCPALFFYSAQNELMQKFM